MDHFFVEPLLNLGEEDLTTIIFESVGSQFNDEIGRCEHSLVEHRQDDRIHNNWSELFHQVKRQGRTSIYRTM
jgi:hypothetical protein